MATLIYFMTSGPLHSVNYMDFLKVGGHIISNFCFTVDTV